MMTREEAIAVLEESKRQNEIMRDNPTTFWASYQIADGIKNTKRRIDALNAALTALSTLQAENEKLRAELEQVKAERDAAVERIREWEKFDTYLFVHNFITPEKWRGPGKEN